MEPDDHFDLDEQFIRRCNFAERGPYDWPSVQVGDGLLMLDVCEGWSEARVIMLSHPEIPAPTDVDDVTREIDLGLLIKNRGDLRRLCHALGHSGTY